ncbi:MAG: hypothetical protein HZA54_08540 [Planctomycetes bacterium]|nr:hypothetical protein [Planctomycetota bacterium]
MDRPGLRFAPVALALLAAAALPALLSAAPPDVPTGSWSLSGRHSERGTYTGTMTIARRPDGVYNVTSTMKFGGTTETWSGTGKVTGYLFKTQLVAAAGGVVDALNNPNAGVVPELIKGTYTLSSNKKSLSGQWVSSLKSSRRGRESLRLAVDTGTTKVDLALIRPDGSELGEDKEETVGEALAVNLDDDDNDGGAGGHAQNNIVADLNDANGIAGDDDLLALKLKKTGAPPAGAVFKLEWPDATLGLYKNADHTGRLTGGAAELPVTDELTLYVEGRAATEGGAPATLSAKLVAGGKTLGEDKLKLTVCRSAFLLLGHGNSGRWNLDSYLSSNRKDSRTNPTIVPGKDKNGKATFWAVYIWDTEKLAKIAMSTPNAVIAYDGHSNFGMGYSFETGYKSVKEFMNIADDQVPVNWPYLRDHQDHPGLLFEDAEYADDSTTSAKFDPVQVGGFDVRGKHGTYDHARYPLNGGSGSRHTLTRGTKKWLDYHYSMGAGEHGEPNQRIVVKAGSADMPAKKWDAIFLNSCYAGPYYWYVFNAGKLFFTTDSASSWKTSAVFIESYLEGKGDEETLRLMNKEENINDYWSFQ